MSATANNCMALNVILYTRWNYISFSRDAVAFCDKSVILIGRALAGSARFCVRWISWLLLDCSSGNPTSNHLSINIGNVMSLAIQLRCSRVWIDWNPVQPSEIFQLRHLFVPSVKLYIECGMNTWRGLVKTSLISAVGRSWYALPVLNRQCWHLVGWTASVMRSLGYS